MAKMKALLDEIVEREEEIISILKMAQQDTIPLFYKLVVADPTMDNVTYLLGDITTDKQFIALVTMYLKYKND